MPKYLLLKILFAVGLIYSLIFHVSLHTSTRSELNSQARITWTQPAVLNAAYPIPISNQGVGFNYMEIEKVVWQFTQTDGEHSGSEQLLVNAETAKQLELACSHMDENVSPTELQRLKFLLTKSMPGQAGQQLNGLLINYCKYIKLHRTSLAEINSAQGNEQLALLIGFMPATEKLQSELFTDENYKDLFATKNSNLRYFTDSRIINLRQDLTQAEKQTQLQILQEAYKSVLSDL